MLYARNICTCIFVKGPAQIGAFTESTGQCSGIVLIFSQVEHHFPIDLPIMLPGRGWLFEASSAWELKAGVTMSWSLKKMICFHYVVWFLWGFSNRFTLASLWEIVWSEEVHQSRDVLRCIRCQTLFFQFFSVNVFLVVLFTSTSRLASLRSSGWPTPLRYEMSFIVITQGFCEDWEMQQFREAVKKCFFLGIIPKPMDPPRPPTFRNKNLNFGQRAGVWVQS